MTDELDELADVVRLHPDRDLEDDDAPVSTEPRAPGYCGHTRVKLNAESRRVTCRDCDREVEAFAYLLGLSKTWERYATHRKGAKERADAAEARLHELLRLERNARARLKRIDPAAERSAPQVPWGDAAYRR